MIGGQLRAAFVGEPVVGGALDQPVFFELVEQAPQPAARQTLAAELVAQLGLTDQQAAAGDPA